MVVLLLWSASGAQAFAATTRVAVATNFLAPLTELAARFEAQTGHELELVAASTGKLFAQIVNGAPYAVFLAADAARPRRLAELGLTAAGSAGQPFTYAVGALVLYTREPDYAEAAMLKRLKTGTAPIAIANERVAPYGAAALEVLETLAPVAQQRVVRADSVGQAFALVATGNAELGLVARSAVTAAGSGSHVAIDERFHTPIRQDAVLLPAGEADPAARAFCRWLRSDGARSLLTRWGYREPVAHTP